MKSLQTAFAEYHLYKIKLKNTSCDKHIQGEKQRMKQIISRTLKIQTKCKEGRNRERMEMKWKSQPQHRSFVLKYCSELMGICLSFQNSCDTKSSGYIIYYIVDTQLKIMKYINYFRHQHEPEIHHRIFSCNPH